MIMTECPTDETLRLHARGQGKLAEENEIWGHVSHCTTCQQNLETLHDSDDSLLGPLREPLDENRFEAESSCRLAVLKALGTLAEHDPGRPLSDGENADDRDSEAESELRVIAEYEIVRPIGQGGMGRVYLARHTKLGREVALKLLVGHRLADPRMRQRFDAEMRAIGKLRNANIVTAHDARNVDGTAVLITEYIDGLDLMQLVARTGPLSVADACEIVRQVATALEYIREQGFVHRDVKPSNVMLSRQAEVKLLDLGLARFLHADESAAMTGTGQTMGTADFVAPEQVTDSRSVDIRADIYSLGCTLFQLLTGVAPFADDGHATTFAKLTAHVSEPPPKLAQRLTGVPVALAKLVDSMLSKRPEQRPATPAVVAERLAEFTVGHNLRSLAERAMAASSAVPATLATTSATNHPVTDSRRRRQVPLSLAIAAGLFGMLVGFALGIVITIKRPDGSQLSITVPDGSDIDIRPSGEAASGSTKGSKMMGGDMSYGGEMLGSEEMGYGGGMMGMEPGAAMEIELPASNGPPLMFAILMNADEVPEEELARAKQQVSRSYAGNPILTEIGYWHEVAVGVSVPIEQTRDGKRYTVVKTGIANLIPWEELQFTTEIDISPPEVSPDGMGYAEPGVQLRFQGHLPGRMRAFTGNHLGRQLAMIVDGKVLTAPRIRQEISDAAQLTGNLTLADLQPLWNALHPRAASGAPAPQKLSIDVKGLDPSQTRLKQIGVAFHQFHDTFGKLPGSTNVYGYGMNAPTPHPFSWRVAILPLLGEQALYDEYRFNEPWDSDHNRTLLAKIPKIYQPLRSTDDPFGGDDFVPSPEGETHLQGFVGPNTAFGDGYGQRFHDMTDGTSNTLLLIESLASVPWTKPADLPSKVLKDADAIRPLPERPLHLLMVDGSVRTMQPLDHNVLTLMILRNDGMRLPTD